MYEQRRQVLAACGFELAAPRWDLRLPEAAVRWAEARVPAGAIHFSINASTPLKEWPLEHWIELAKRLLAKGTVGPDYRHRERQCPRAGTVAVAGGGSGR